MYGLRKEMIAQKQAAAQKQDAPGPSTAPVSQAAAPARPAMPAVPREPSSYAPPSWAGLPDGCGPPSLTPPFLPVTRTCAWVHRSVSVGAYSLYSHVCTCYSRACLWYIDPCQWGHCPCTCMCVAGTSIRVRGAVGVRRLLLFVRPLLKDDPSFEKSVWPRAEDLSPLEEME